MDYKKAAKKTTKASTQAKKSIATKRKRVDAPPQTHSQVLHSMAEAVIYTDPQGVIRYTNPAFDRVFGYEPGELIGQPVSLLNALPPAENARLVTKILKTTRNGGTWDGELLNRRKDGMVIRTRARVTGMSYAGEMWAVGVQEDITERKRMEEALLFTQFSLNTATDEMVCVDRDARFVDVNEAFCRSSGYSREELLSMTVHDIDPVYSGEIWPAFWEKLKQNVSLTFETSHRTREGKVYPVEVVATFFEYNGKEYHSAFARDITERKAAGSALAESQRLLQTIIDTAPIRVFWKDVNLRFLGCNPAFAADAGKTSPSEVVGNDDYMMGWADQADAYRADDRAVVDSGTSKLFYEEPQTTPDGRTIWLSTSKVPLRNRNNEIVGMLGIYQEITERKQAEEALRRLNVELETRVVERTAQLRENEERLNFLLSATPVTIYTCHPEPPYATTFISANVTDALGYSVDEYLCAPNFWVDHIHPKDRERVLAELPRLFEHGRGAREYRFRNKDADWRWIHDELRVVPGSDGSPAELIGYFLDITKHKALEAALRDKEHLLSESQRIAHIGGWSWDLKGTINWTNETYRIYGVSPETFSPTIESLVNLVHPEDRTAMQRWLEACAAGEKPADLEFRAVLPDGSVCVLSGRGELMYDAENKPAVMSGTVQDITARKQLEHELFESEARCRSIFERVPLGITVVGTDGRFVFANSAWARMIGYSVEELLQMNVLDLTYPEDQAESLRTRASLNAGNIDEFVLDRRYVRKNGDVFWTRVIGATLRDERGAVTGTGRVAVIEDTTKQKEIEVRLADQRRLQRDALVREVHHRIKNHLQGVAGLLERHAAANPALEPAMEELLGQLGVLATVHGLQSEISGRELNLCNIVRGIVDALQIVSTVPLEFTLPEGFVPIEVNADEAVPIALILNELVSNAVKHMATSDQRGIVEIVMKPGGAGALIIVRNTPARLPPEFDFGSGRSLGTGLRLARSLLPGEGARLTFSQPAADLVESVLELWPPVLIHAVSSVSET